MPSLGQSVGKLWDRFLIDAWYGMGQSTTGAQTLLFICVDACDKQGSFVLSVSAPTSRSCATWIPAKFSFPQLWIILGYVIQINTSLHKLLLVMVFYPNNRKQKKIPVNSSQSYFVGKLLSKYMFTVWNLQYYFPFLLHLQNFPGSTDTYFCKAFSTIIKP